MKKSKIKLLLKLFVSWRMTLFIFLLLGTILLPLQENFLGGGLTNYLAKPWFWAWSNFDGEHYLSIAQNGYQPLTYFFFPLYPILIAFVGNLFGGDLVSFSFAGQLISNISILFAIWGLWRLVRIDYKKNIAQLTVLTLLVFPTSFYFVSVYTESLFLALVVWCFYFARKKKWFYAGLLGGLASTTRIIGLALFPAILIEYFIALRRPLVVRRELARFIPILLIPLGLIVYMFYLNKATGDPLEFFNTMGVFGEQRSTLLVLLPQVFYRYVIKILPSVNYSYFPTAYTAWLEFLTAFLFTILSVVAFFRLRLGYAVYLAIAFLVPTLAGSFSSMPRYALVLFPGFILLANWLARQSKTVKIFVFTVLAIGLLITTTLFTRAFWVS